MNAPEELFDFIKDLAEKTGCNSGVIKVSGDSELGEVLKELFDKKDSQEPKEATPSDIGSTVHGLVEETIAKSTTYLKKQAIRQAIAEGNCYRHFKGGLYYITRYDIDDSVMPHVMKTVFYKDFDGGEFERPYDEFFGQVAKPGYVGPRFTKVKPKVEKPELTEDEKAIKRLVKDNTKKKLATFLLQKQKDYEDVLERLIKKESECNDLVNKNRKLKEAVDMAVHAADKNGETVLELTGKICQVRALLK